MDGSYNYALVALSILIALLGSYATLDLAARVTASHGGARLSWRIGGATVLAIGTWATHHVGMVALRLPVPILYDWPTALLSFLPSLLASALTLVVVIRPKVESLRAFVASIFIGGGIAALHYTAMMSMRFQGTQRYSPTLVILSVLLAMVFALLSVWLTFLFRNDPGDWKLRKLGSVALMGTAICAMHYTGMSSATFIRAATAPDLSHAVSIPPVDALGLGALALTIVAAAVMSSTLDRLQRQKVVVNELFEQAPQAVVLMTPDYNVVRVNREFIQMFGYSREEAIGRNLSELIVPEELQDEAQEIMKLLAHGERIQRETIRRRKDGRRLNVSIVHVPVSLPGEQVGRYAIYRDITARKEAEESLGQAHSRIESVLNSVTNVHILFDSEFRYVYVNEAAVRTIGRPREGILGRTIWELYPDLVGTELDRQCHLAMEERVPLAFDFHYLKRNIWWESRVSPTPGGLSVYATDISERKRVEEQLRESEERFRQMAESITEVFWMTSPDKKQVLYISPEYEKIWGRSCKSIYEAPTSWLDAIHPDDRQNVEKASMTWQNRGDYDEEYRVVQPSGAVRWIRDRAFPISDSEGRVYRITGIAEDITDRKLAEEKIKATSAQLRALSARLQSAREVEAIRIAREIHDELGAALSSLRWDLEGLAEAISQIRELSHSGDLSTKIEAMKSLIDSTINSVRRIASELRPIGLDDLGLIEAIELHARQFQERTGIIVDCDCVLERVNLSPEKSTAVFRIFQEALTNILRHAQAKVVNLQVREENEVFMLKISDNGRGITDDEKSGKRTLGLLGMRERARLIGGKIEITGIDGEGTVITLRIPISATEEFGTTLNE
ncbi:MAG TPA: PAS domain S-box protein [Pyrinomonadaceae bacterium]|jgi:PAS domain S-box-containing protein|nr:PAS domain S-box protein [Pyrinomonadaceae bacterium]